MIQEVVDLSLALLSAWAAYHVFLLLYPILDRGVRRASARLEPSRVAVLIPTRDEGRVLRELLDGLNGSAVQKIVIDGSRDGPLGFSREMCSSCLLIEEGEPRGKPAALNVGLSRASGDYICVLDADCRPPQGLLDAIPSPSISGALQCAIDPMASGSLISSFAETEERAWFSMMLSARYRLGLFVPMAGSAMVVERGLLEELGGWREDSLTEDMDISLRMFDRGILTEYIEEPKCGKLVPNSLKALIVQRIRWYRGYLDLLPLGLKLFVEKPGLRSLDALIQLFYPLAMSAGLLVGLSVTLLTALGMYVPGPMATISLILMISLISLISSASRGGIGKGLLVASFMWGYWTLLSAISLIALLGKMIGVRVRWMRTPRDGMT